VRWQFSGRSDVDQFELLVAFLARVIAKDIIYPLYLVYGVLTGQDVTLAGGADNRYLKLKDDGGWLAHVRDICKLLAQTLRELQAWHPEGPRIQDVVEPAPCVAGGQRQDVQHHRETLDVRQANWDLYHSTVFGSEKFPTRKHVSGMKLAIQDAAVLDLPWEAPDELPRNPDVWMWPGEYKSMYINANFTYAWCFEFQLGPDTELPKRLTCSFCGHAR
jgi:hypothetical protein